MDEQEFDFKIELVATVKGSRTLVSLKPEGEFSWDQLRALIIEIFRAILDLYYRKLRKSRQKSKLEKSLSEESE